MGQTPSSSIPPIIVQWDTITPWQLLNRLSASQIWALIGVIFAVFGAAFAIGMWTESVRSASAMAEERLKIGALPADFHNLQIDNNTLTQRTTAAEARVSTLQHDLDKTIALDEIREKNILTLISDHEKAFKFIDGYLGYLISRDMQSPDFSDRRGSFIGTIRFLYIDRVIQLHADDVVDKNVGSTLLDGHVRVFYDSKWHDYPIVPEIQGAATSATSDVPTPHY